MKRILIIIGSVALSYSGIAQTVLMAGAQSFTLKDRSKAVVFPAKDCANCYYYMPSNFRISFNDSKEPEVSLLKIQETENAPIIGGLLHLLLVWGFDAAQDAELQKLVRSVDSLGVVMGATTVETEDALPGINISGKDELAKVFREALKSSSGIATTPGSKMALAFRFDEEQMKVLQTALDNPNFKSDAAIEMNLIGLVRTAKMEQRVKIKQQVKLTELFNWIR